MTEFRSNEFDGKLNKYDDLLHSNGLMTFLPLLTHPLQLDKIL